jgi:hypothetical protein
LSLRNRVVHDGVENAQTRIAGRLREYLRGT